MPFAASPTFGLLYRSTVAHFPQAFLFLIIAVYLLVEYNEFQTVGDLKKNLVYCISLNNVPP